jgi:hypothetical protein
MKQTLTLNNFRDEMVAIRPNNFSYDGLEILFDWFEDVELMDGKEVEFDPIAFCCEYSESNIQDLINYYAIDLDGVEPDEIDAYVLDYLNDRTIVLGVCEDGAIVYQNF